MTAGWETVIGLEVHVQLRTSSKLFSAAATAFGAEPNTQACAVDLALPGVLPVLNEEAVRQAVLFGVAVGGTVAERCRFDRKSYYYPDLPKGYQISQFEEPVVRGGSIAIDAEGGVRRIELTRAHLEEDAGKSLHEDYPGFTAIDLNRAGTPLLEVVSEPQLHRPEEAVAYFRALRALALYLGICDGNLNEGSMRCDANVSVRRPGAPLGERTEIKNLNSFRFLDRALRFEIERQIDILESGGEVLRETLLYDAERDETRPMRGKELSDDYRYFPDPDLLPVAVDAAMIDAAKAALPELPDAKRRRYREQFGLADSEASQLAAEPQTARYFEALAAASGDPKTAAHWIIGDVAAALHREDADMAGVPVSPAQLGLLLRRVADQTISRTAAKSLFELLWQGEDDVDALIESRGLKQVSDSGELARLVEEALAAYPAQAAEYRAGKTKLLGFFVGQVMKASGGKANPKQVNELARAALAGE